jgi:hypothetical protein
VEDDLEETENRRGERHLGRVTPNRVERGLVWINASESRRPSLAAGKPVRAELLNGMGERTVDEIGRLHGERSP